VLDDEFGADEEPRVRGASASAPSLAAARLDALEDGLGADEELRVLGVLVSTALPAVVVGAF
jgi:hypothetical protein